MTSSKRDVAVSFDWNTSIKPLLAASHNNFVFNADLLKLVRSIQSSCKEILDHAPEFEPFYSSFISLSAHFITTNFSQIPKNEFSAVSATCRTCIDFILSHLEKHYDQTSVTSKQLLLLIKGFCKGTGCLQKSDTMKLTATMKSFQLPPNVRPTIGTDKNLEDQDAKSSKSRSDPLLEIVDFLSSPLTSNDVKTDKDKQESASTSSVEKSVKDLLIEANIRYLLRKEAGSILINACSKLPFFGRYTQMANDLLQRSKISFLSEMTECLTTQELYSSLRADLTTVSLVISLPLFEPLITERLSKLCHVGFSSLLVSCNILVCNNILSASSSDQKLVSENESCAHRIIEKSLNIFAAIASIVQSSPSTGGSQLQNYRILGLKCFCVGIQYILEHFEIENAAVAIGQNFVNIFRLVLIDLQSELGKSDDLNTLNIDTLSTASQKIKFINKTKNLVPVLLEMATLCLSKALALRQRPKTVQELASRDGQDTIPDIDQSGDEGPYSLNNSGDTNDGEPLLGNWLEELLASVPQLIDSGDFSNTGRKKLSTDSTTWIGSKDDPALFANLSINCFNLLNDYLFNTTNNLEEKMCSFVWTERESNLLASALRSMENNSYTFGSKIHSDLDLALTTIVHNLIANSCFWGNEIIFLAKLGVSINAEAKEDWPLELSQRMLSILGQILLLRCKKIDGKSKSVDEDSVITNIWQRLLSTLSSKILTLSASRDAADINAEHLQLLLLLFHSLSLMQKKVVFVNTMSTIVSTADKLMKQEKSFDSFFNSLHFSRLFLIFDYMIRYFYDPPPGLIDDIRNNIFRFSKTTTVDSKDIKAVPRISSKASLACPEFDEVNKRKVPAAYQCKTQFYNIAPEVAANELIKLDGLASSFMLNNDQYSEFYDCLSRMLVLPFIRKNEESSDSRETSFKISVYTYNMRILWRLLTELPPPISCLKRLIDATVDTNQKPFGLNTIVIVLRFMSRFSDSTFAAWMEDGLCKQKMNPKEAAQLIDNFKDRICSLEFGLNFFESVFKSLAESGKILPSLTEMIIADLLLNRFFALLLDKGTEVGEKFEAKLNVILPLLSDIAQMYLAFTKSCIIDDACRSSSDPLPDTAESKALVHLLMSIAAPCIGSDFSYDFGVSSWLYAHSSIRKLALDWLKDDDTVRGYPSYKIDSESDGFAVPDGSFSQLFATHLRIITEAGLCLIPVVQRLLYANISVILFIMKKFSPSVVTLQFCDKNLVPLLVDLTTSCYLSEDIFKALNDSKLYVSKSDHLCTSVNTRVSLICYELILRRCSASDNVISFNIIDSITDYFENLFDKPYGRDSLAAVLINAEKMNVLLNNAFFREEPGHQTKFLRLFIALLRATENYSRNAQMKSLSEKICVCLLQEFESFKKWLDILIKVDDSVSEATDTAFINDAQNFLYFISNALKRNSSSDISATLAEKLLSSLIELFHRMLENVTASLSGKTSPPKSLRMIPDLFYVMASLAAVESSKGHIKLLHCVIDWLDLLNSYLKCADENSPLFADQSNEEKQNPSKSQVFFDLLHVLFNYISESFIVSRDSSSGDVSKVYYDSDMASDVENEADVADESGAVEEEESAADESDDESALDNKLCTFAVTQKEFMNQHWYHCHTCGMIDGEGACTVCAKVCHKGHDLSYSKFGSFFCDCGARGGCLALTKRTKPKPNVEKIGDSKKYKSSKANQKFLRKRKRLDSESSSTLTDHSATTVVAQKSTTVLGSYLNSVESYKTEFKTALTDEKAVLLSHTHEIVEHLLPIVGRISSRCTALGFTQRMFNDMNIFHQSSKTYETTENLTNSAQSTYENALENMKLALTGDTGQTIKHLISNHVIQRTSLLSLKFDEQRRHFFLAAHDRCKISTFSLTPVVKSADGKKSLVKVASETLPFTILSITSNALAPEYVAVCGFKELHVLVFGSSGMVSDRLVLMPPLDGGNYILKAIWLPCSTSKLALITADYIRVYDLERSLHQPCYHFMLAAGKIIDSTFISSQRNQNGKHEINLHLMLLSNSGHLYLQNLDDQSTYALQGSLYITTNVVLHCPDLEEKDGIISLGGCSLYFSHKLQTVFVSFLSGISIYFPFTKIEESVNKTFTINWRSSMKSLGMQALYRWSESLEHPGLVAALTHTSQNPLLFVMKPCQVVMQEIVTPSKSKVVDYALVNCSSVTPEMTTCLLVAGEDGSLRVFNVNNAVSDHWLPKRSVMSMFMPTSKKRQKSKLHLRSEKLDPPPFQVDFFESCQALSNVEFGGNDLLQIYNQQLLKDRLDKTNLYVACAKANGFQIDITSNDESSLICGVRIELGKHSVQKAPTYFEVFGRRQMVNVTRVRWFDFPFSREETVAANNRISIVFGPSRDDSKVNFVDSIKVYGKARDSFGWVPADEEPEQDAATMDGAVVSAAGVTVPELIPCEGFASAIARLENFATSSSHQGNLLAAEQTIVAAFSALNHYLDIFADNQEDVKKMNQVVIPSLVMTLCPDTLRKARMVIRKCFKNKTNYYSMKDDYVLSYAIKQLQNLKEPIDPEMYSFLVLMIRNICIFRPDSIAKKNLLCLKDFIALLIAKFWAVYDQIAAYPKYSSAGKEDMFCCELLIQAIVDVLHAVCLSQPDSAAVAEVVKSYCSFLLSKHLRIAYACRMALMSLFKKKSKEDASSLSSLPKIPSALSTSLQVNAGSAFRTSTPSTNRPGVVGSAVISASETSSSAQQAILSSANVTSADEQSSTRANAGQIRQAAAVAQQQQFQVAASIQEEPGIEYEQRAESIDLAQPDSIDVVDHDENQNFDNNMAAVGGGHYALDEEEEDDDNEEDDVDPYELMDVEEHGAEGGPDDGIEHGQADHIFDLSGDVDDEQQLVEIAIALSLQDQNSGQNTNPETPAEPVYAPPPTDDSVDQAEHFSDSTASGMSDDEASNVVTDNSNLHVSPGTDQVDIQRDVGGCEHDSESPASISGRSSAISGQNIDIQNKADSKSQSSTSDIIRTETSMKPKKNLALSLIEEIVQYLRTLDNYPGIQCISLLQVAIGLVGSLNMKEKDDQIVVSSLINAIVKDLHLENEDVSSMCERSQYSEVNLLRLRFLSVFLSKGRSSDKTAATPNDIFVAKLVTTALATNGAVDYCANILKIVIALLSQAQKQEDKDYKKKLLPPRSDATPADFSPIFLRPYVKEHCYDIFDNYLPLITEMVLRLPYQFQRINKAYSPETFVPFKEEWNDILCNLMRCEQTSYVRRQIKKLLLFICDTRERYRALRDLQTMRFHLASIKNLCSEFMDAPSYNNEPEISRKFVMNYSMLNNMMDFLKAILEIANSRPCSWQSFCLNEKDSLQYLMALSCCIDDAVASVILSLIQISIGTLNYGKDKKKVVFPQAKKDEKEYFKFSEQSALYIIEKLLKEENRALFSKTVKYFLFSCNASECRWQIHAIMRSVFESKINAKIKEGLLQCMWNDLWPFVSRYGKKSAQFVDLLGYYTAKFVPSSQMQPLLIKVLELLKKQNNLLTDHPNAYLYNTLSLLLEFDGYYLETNPCLVCNNPEVPMNNIKLNSLKMDARFTTTSQMIKLINSHEISKITLKISELRRSKTIKQLKLYYSNKVVPSAVELKNKPDIWLLAKTFNLSQAQPELKMEFSVPIVACNVMMEYSDFFEVPSAAPETLHCPRCSAAVPATPGICANCNENVYQCHKCRAINYDDKDPFLCNSCGYSKYGKFDYTVYGRAVAGVEPIENEEDRKKTLTHINSLLDKADQLYKQLLATRPHIESLLAAATGQEIGSGEESAAGRSSVGQDVAVGSITPGLVNRSIQLLALKYNRDCRMAFEELSKVVQKLIANKNELLEYDRRQRDMCGLSSVYPVHASMESSRDCFGCAAATAQQCILLVRATTTSSEIRRAISTDAALIDELTNVAFKQSSLRGRQAARELICSVIKGQKMATTLVCEAIENRVFKAIRENEIESASPINVQCELQLLFQTLILIDDCWEIRLKALFKILLRSLRAGMCCAESITLPCLIALETLFVKTKQAERSKSANSSNVNIFGWLQSDDSALTYETFKQTKLISQKESSPQRRTRLMQKFGLRWLNSTIQARSGKSVWFDDLLFCLRSSQTRSHAAFLLENLTASLPSRKAALLDLLTKHLDKLETLGDKAQEFVRLYVSLIKEEEWKIYLIVRGKLAKITNLIEKNVESLDKLENSAINMDMSQGYTLKVLCDLLFSFLQVESIKKAYKNSLLGVVLNSYLGLKRLLIQRTKHIDDAQSKLLETLELITTGNEKDTEEFIKTCVLTVEKYPLDDLRTPLFIFERINSIIFPEEKEVGEFLINVEKDAAQDDFLQGRMMGNPYKSTDVGMGPLMRDIKNKICRDCELISLLEDDTGMELLVNGKIISLELPVSEVYKKIWQPQHQGEAMLIVYRMRGLLGDATEEFVDNLQSSKSSKSDDEEIYRRSRVIGQCGGLKLMLERLKNIKTIHVNFVLPVLLTLFDYCVRVRLNRIALLDPTLKSVNILLSAAKPLLNANEPDTIALGEKLLSIINRILSEAESLEENEFEKFCEEGSASESDFKWLLCQAYEPHIQNNVVLKENVFKTISNLTMGSAKRTSLLIEHFRDAIKFDAFDNGEAQSRITSELDALCFMVANIQVSKYGTKLKNDLINVGFVSTATNYLTQKCPPLYKVGSTIDSPDWKEFLSRPSLKYVLRMLTGFCKNHEACQLLVAEECIPVIHRLEPVSSEERVGTLAENLMEVLKANEQVAKKIEEVRQETKTKKRNLAMAMRQKQLVELGMKMTEKGQVMSDTSVVKKVVDVTEEPGLTCSVCREGYKYLPQKLLGVYTFTKRCNCEDFERESRKTAAYSTVTHFNAIHFECHAAGVRSARGRDEWDSALLQNANTKCNGLLPICGVNISEADYAAGLAKHNGYIQDYTGIPDINFCTSIHDLKLLIVRFAFEKSFSEETGGGGRESNAHLIPYLLTVSCYLLTQTQSIESHNNRFNTFISMPVENWKRNAFECEGPLYYAAAALALCSYEDWKNQRVTILKRLIVAAQVRATSLETGSTSVLDNSQARSYVTYKPYLLFFGMIEAAYTHMFQDVKAAENTQWPGAIFQYIRSHDWKVIENSKRYLKFYENDLLPCESFTELCDILGLLPEIENADEFFQSCVSSVP